MGQKVNPISNRLGIIRGWDSNWFGGKTSVTIWSKTAKYVNTLMSVWQKPVFQRL